MRTRYVERNLNAAPRVGQPFSQTRRWWDTAGIAFGVLVFVILTLAFAASQFGWLPYDPDQADLDLILAPPGSPGHVLGTDFFGRDLATRLIVGVNAYFLPALGAVAVSLFIGATLGLAAGFRGGPVGLATHYTCTLVEAIPRLLLVLFAVTVYQPDIYYIMLIIGLTGFPGLATRLRLRIRHLREQSFFESALASGVSLPTILFKHLLWHHCRPLFLIHASQAMGEAILFETSLSYLGFGVQEPTPSWGNMIQTGSDYLLQGNFWPSTLPAAAIAITLIAFYLFADAFERRAQDRQDP